MQQQPQQQQVEGQVLHSDYLRDSENLRTLAEAGWVYADRGAANPDLQIWVRTAPPALPSADPNGAESPSEEDEEQAMSEIVRDLRGRPSRSLPRE
jgi:hypothetical protein